ncbi:MAG: formylglycine-generating enzyme family protein [Patescibacteria group bacterium]
MKRQRTLITATTAFVVAITLATQTFGQVDINPITAKKVSSGIGLGKALALKEQEVLEKANVPIPTASETLTRIVEEVKNGKFPIEIYPPHFLEQLEKMGDQPMYAPESFDRSASALKAGDRANMLWMDATFTIGSPSSEALRGSDETQHTVTLTGGFYIGRYEVTQGEYLALVGSNPSYFTPANGYSADLNRPVDSVTWHNATNYCGLLTQQERANGHILSTWQYRLPTEAEWQYSCRAGTTTAFSFGNAIHGGDANFYDNYEYDASSGETYIASPTIPWLNRSTTVGSYNPNSWGFFDMHGNVDEWCLDWYGSYPSGSLIDPQGPSSGSSRMLLGGSWGDAGQHTRSAFRNYNVPTLSASPVGFRIVLAPNIPEWYTAITTQPPQPVFGNLPTKGSGKDSLVVVTHGWEVFITSLLPPDISWVDGMSNSINSYLTGHSLNNWQVYGYKWVDGAWKVNPQDALNNGKQEGKILGNYIASQGWTHVHLIGHSAGAGLIQAASERIKAISPSTTVHCTFLDAFVGFDKAGIANYGNGANWSDNYFTRDSLTSLTGPYTEGPLDHAYNVDVTQLDPNKVGSTKFRSSATGLMEPCYKTLPTHEGPHIVYNNTITGSVTADYAGFGFPLSEEGGNWSYALANYTVGNTTPQVLGTPDPTCTSDIQVTPPSYLNTVPDFTQFPTIESTTGTIQKYIDHFNLLSGSPAWLAVVITSTNPVNTVSFDANFTSGTGAQGLLTVLWDADTIGTLDERVIGSGVQHYQFRFPNAVINSTHVLGFRLDPFTNIQSTVTMTNVVLNQVGPSQTFSLGLTGASTNGALVYKLTGESGFNYGIQASSNLVNWATIATLANTNGTVQFFDQSSTNYPMRFYRGTVAD